MAKREISIVLKAKNQLQAGLAKAGAQLKGFGESVVNVGKRLALAFAGGTAALAATMAKAQEFNKQIGQITTVSDLSFSQASSAVRKLSAQFGLAKEELTKGLYDALSAGIPQENVFDFMATASKTAIAGATTTKEAVDFLTSAINAFKIPAGEADKVADTLFQTVKLGKTTVSELAAAFSVVGPIAASSGVAFEQVMAAAASLTKQGTPTSVAMTQIRSAIIAMNENLGDGWSKTMTLQQGMQAMADMAGGSQTKLKDLTGRVEGMNAILGITGANAQMAASDLNSVAGAAGAANEAFGKMADVNPLEKARQAFSNLILVIGDNAIKTLGPYIEDWTSRLAAFAEEVEAWASSGGMINLTAQIQGFVTEAVYRFQLLGNAFKVAAAVLRDTYGPPIQYVAGLIAAFVGKAQTDFRALGESLSYIASSIRRPWEFSMSELTSLFKRHAANTVDAQKQLISALKGEDVKLTEHGVAALTEREEIHNRYNERIKKVYEDQANALARLDRLAVTSTADKAAQVIQIEQQASDRVIDLKQEEAREIAQVAQEAATQKTEIEQGVVNRIVEENIRAKDQVTNAWRSGVDDFRNAEEEKVSIAKNAASRILAAQTGFNQGLLGRTFESGGGGDYYNQAVTNLRRQGYQIGGVARPGSRVAGAQMIQQEIARLRAEDEARAERDREAERLYYERQREEERLAEQRRQDELRAARLRLPSDFNESDLERIGARTNFQSAANDPRIIALAEQFGGLSNIAMGGLRELVNRIGYNADVNAIVAELRRIREQNDSLLRMN